MLNFQETRTRSLTKTITWRVAASLITWSTIFWFTGKPVESTKITFIVALLAMIAYYFHERIWNNIDWGKISQ